MIVPLLAGAAIAAGIVWVATREKEEPCPFDMATFHAWCLDRGFGGFYAFNADVPPELSAVTPQAGNVTYDRLVVVTKSGSFWRYRADGKAEAAPDLRAQYCIFWLARMRSGETQTSIREGQQAPTINWLPPPGTNV